jgi:hypothetical protein
MDIFIEKIVRKEKSSKDSLYKLKVIALALLAFLLSAFIVFIIPIISFIFPVLLVVIVFGTYYALTSLNVEFEYTVTNDDIDIDKIIAQRKRKKIFNTSCKNFEVVARITSDEYAKQPKDFERRIEAVSSMNSPDVYFAVLSYQSKRTIVFFEPDKRILDTFKTYIPRKVF